MSRSRQAREAARTMVTPLFAWSNAVLKTGELMLDSMEAVAKNAHAVRVAVLPNGGAAPAPRKAKARPARAKRAGGRRRR